MDKLISLVVNYKELIEFMLNQQVMNKNMFYLKDKPSMENGKVLEER